MFIIDKSRVRLLPDGTFEHITDRSQYQIPILSQNYIERMNGSNGWSKKRAFRKIASIPLIAVEKAQAEGYDLGDRRDLERFLQKHPEYKTVEKIDSNFYKDPRIIIK